MTLLRADRLAVRYAHGGGLAPVDLSIASGEGVALVGRNGSGKSTLLRALAGVEPRAVGSIDLHGRACHHERHRVGMAYVAQRAVARWDLPLSVQRIVATGLLPLRPRVRRVEAARRVGSALRAVDALDLADRPVGELSGGQAQRVLLARALVAEPDLLLLDEPFAGLDIAASARLAEVLGRLLDDGMTILCALHELDLARGLFARGIALVDGAVVADGPIGDVLAPASVARVFVPGAAV